MDNQFYESKEHNMLLQILKFNFRFMWIFVIFSQKDEIIGIL